MFDNIDETLKTIAWINFIAWCILALVSLVSEPSQLMLAVVGSKSIGIVKFISLVVCAYTGFVSSAILNAFAKIVEFTYVTASETRRNNEKLERFLKAQDSE